jgi:hypothetical protein
VRIAIALLALLAAAPAFGQVNGHVSVIADVLPDIDASPGAQTVSELRVRLFAERRDELGSHLRITLSGYVDALIADRTNVGGIRLLDHRSLGEGGKADSTIRLKPDSTSTDFIVRPADLFVDIVTSRFDLRAGAARLVWGRLDEFQPTDVVNPIDLSRFLMEGRSEARLTVGLVRGRVFLPRSTTLEAVAVPHFRRGRFDQLEEESSPFNLTRSSIPTVRDEPDAGAESLQGGVRITSTIGRVDWAVSAYRGIRAFPISTIGADLKVGPYEDTLTPSTVSADPLVGAGLQAGPSLVIRESFPRFTMVGGDFETVRGAWGVRGEIAAFVEDELQSTRTARGVPGHSVTAGIGVDRRAGDYRVAANALWSWSGVDADDPVGQSFVGDEEVERTDLSLVVAADRSFARETRTLRVFAVYDPADSTAFTRVIGAVSVRDNVWLEGSAGVFTGSSLDVIGRLTRRDFLYARLKVFF